MPSIQAFVQPFLAKVALKVLTASCSEGETAPRRTISVLRAAVHPDLPTGDEAGHQVGERLDAVAGEPHRRAAQPVDLSQHEVAIFAEIVDAPKLSVDAIVERARATIG